MTVILILLIVASDVPVSISLSQDQTRPSEFWKAAVAIAASSCLQAIFIVCLSKQFLSLDHSIRFAAVGIPLCILALVLAKRGNFYSRGPLISASIGIVIWMIFITLH